MEHSPPRETGKLPQPRGPVFRRSNPARPEPYRLRCANLLSESQPVFFLSFFTCLFS
jgi:hypothetical protein